MTDRVTAEGISRAYHVIDPVFVDSPQYACDPLSHKLGMTVVLKVECLNPIRSFKGRGADYLLHQLGHHASGYVCASAGNFGQGMAYAARKRRSPITVFAATDANPMKVERMRELGATVVLHSDYDGAKQAAREHADKTGAMFVEDGALASIAEGAGTIALELTGMPERIDAVVVPVGDGALITGIGTWMREKQAGTMIIGVVADGAPAMEMSRRAGRAVATERTDTIADGIAVRSPIASAVEEMRRVVDDIVRVGDDDIVAAMKALMRDAGLVVEPAGAAGLAAAGNLRAQLRGRRVAVIITGGNITDDQIRRWLVPV
jgi:threonine dehydratase